jgi:type II secretory pathway pseudopilin PulG
VEIMVVVAIIALLAVFAVPNLLRAKIEANQTYAQASLKSIGTAMENYTNINGQYPASTTLLLGITPPYLTTDYFTGSHFGYSFIPSLAQFTYSITAIPATTGQGMASFTISTGAIITKN